MAILPTLLNPYVVNDRISQLVVNNMTLQSRFGMGAGGSAVRRHPARKGTYDIFDDTRELPYSTTPGSHSVSRERFPIGEVNYKIPRSAEHRTMPLEELNQLRPLGGPATEIDELGTTYLMDQERNVKQLNTNLRKFQCAALLRGSYSITQQADGFSHGFSGGTYTVNYQIPTGNKTQLDMLGDGDIIGTSWDNAAAPIIRDILAINAAFVELVGLGLRDIYVTSTVWSSVITNTEVQNLAGSMNNPVSRDERNDTTEERTAQLAGFPSITWHINDNGLNIGAAGSATFTKLIADTAAVFCTTMDDRVAVYRECPEPVLDPVSQQVTNQYGEYYYHKFIDDPVAWEFHNRFNGLPILLIPKAIGYGTVVF